ncbi:MAG: isopeptide-forming domain-containing fimbrial protein [Lachnospiraceae bacterium]|nr:isopeptide-forming domain-containing fimbrial protein [Lachnospiraceae bacterium]
MKKWKRLMVLLLAVLIAAGMKTTVLASEPQAATTGSITIKDADGKLSDSVSGKTFKAYRILDLQLVTGTDTTEYVYTVPDKWKSFFLDYFNKGLTEENYKLKSDSGSFSYDVYSLISELTETQLFDLGVEAVNWAGENNINADGTATAQTNDTSVTIKDLSLGYYVVADTSTASSENTVSAVMLDSTDPDMEVNLKAETPTLEKDIITVQADATVQPEIKEETSDYNNASIGDVEYYKLTSSVPAMTGYTEYYYIVNDTFSEGLTFNGDVKVTIERAIETDKVTVKDGTETQETGYPTIETETVMLDCYYLLYTKNADDSYSWKYYEDMDGTTSATIDDTTDSQYFYIKILVEMENDTTPKTDDNGNTISMGEIQIVFHDFLQYRAASNAVQSGDESTGITTTTTTTSYGDIVITYSATVNENAVIGSEGNTNTATLTYSNDPNYTSDGSKQDLPDEPDPDKNVPTEETPEETTYTYVAGIQLTKVDGVDDTKKLTGAEFTITGEQMNKVLVTGIDYFESDNGTYYKLNDGTYTETDPSTLADTSAYASTEIKYEKTEYVQMEDATQNIKVTGIVDSNGVLEFDGLAAGTYLIEEITAPDGYNLLSQPILVIISWTAPTDTKTSTDCTWSAVSYLEWSENNGVYTYKDTDKIELGVTKDDGKGTTIVGILTLDVANNSGTILPSTGGMGTTLFYVIGGLLMFIAAVLLITKSRMRKSE